MSDDEFDLDFVSNASKKVHENWNRNVETIGKRSISVTESKNGQKQSSLPASPVKKKKGKENSANTTKDDDDREEEVPVMVSITPPSSACSTPQSGVRGANRTKKTQKALEKILSSKLSNRIDSLEHDLSVNTTLGEEILLSDEEEQNLEIKIRWRTEIVRVGIKQGERMGKVADRVAEQVGLPPGDVNLYLTQGGKEEVIGRDQTVSSLQLSIVSVLQARARLQQTGDTAIEEGGLQVKLQTKDRRAQPVLLNLRPTDTMESVMERFSRQAGLARDKLKFFFDGEQLEGKDTAEDLELEGGECIDVHVS